MDIDENILQLFISECLERLEDMEEALLKLEHDSNNADLINRVFSAAHTIKGNAGLFGFDDIIEFTHDVENLLEGVRNCLVPVTAELINLLMQSKDYIACMVNGLSGGQSPAESEGNKLLELLAAFQTGKESDSKNPTAQEVETVVSDFFHISLRLGKDSFRQGFNPAVLFKQLRKLGKIEHAHLVKNTIPALDKLDPENCHLGWEMALKTGADKSDIEDTFQYVSDAAITILPPKSRIEQYARLITQLPEENTAIGQMLIAVGTLTPRELQLALKMQKDTGNFIGEILVDQQSVQPETIDSALKKQNKTDSTKQGSLSLVKVDSLKLDKLVNLVGELVIGGAKVSQISALLDNEDLSQTVEEISTSLEELRETALNLRMVPIGASFNRFQRVVRDTARELGKEMRLEIHGGDTELDKTVIDRIGDPLTHLVRNAIDHGIELPDERLQAGKPQQGLITLKAYHEAGAIVIQILDDGCGMDTQRILAVATKRGLIKPGQKLSDSETYQLIFEPGFSTADTVSNISGRGVGMDIVRRNIEALRGTVDVSSQPGQGTQITIHLPLTLAIIDGFHIKLGNESFIIPLGMMVECITLTESQNEELHGHDYITLRDEILPLVRLISYFDIENNEQTLTKRQNVVVVQFAGRKTGFLVDVLHGEVQAVIKPLGKVFQGLQGFSGFTILGSGEVALILDVPSLIEEVSRQQQDYQNHRSTIQENSWGTQPRLH